LTFLRYIVKLKLQKARREISKRDDLITTNDYLKILIEISIYIIFPNPFIQGLFYIYWNKQKLSFFIEKCIGMRMFVDDSWMTYEVNHLLSIFMMLRVIFLIRMGLFYTIYLTPRAYRLWFFNFLWKSFNVFINKVKSTVAVLAI